MCLYPSDLDQIKADLSSPRHLQIHKETKAPEDLPDLGKHYCIECAKWFVSEPTLVAHKRGKPHKRRYVFAVRGLVSSCRRDGATIFNICREMGDAEVPRLTFDLTEVGSRELKCVWSVMEVDDMEKRGSSGEGLCRGKGTRS